MRKDPAGLGDREADVAKLLERRIVEVQRQDCTERISAGSGRDSDDEGSVGRWSRCGRRRLRRRRAELDPTRAGPGRIPRRRTVPGGDEAGLGRRRGGRRRALGRRSARTAGPTPATASRARPSASRARCSASSIRAEHLLKPALPLRLLGAQLGEPLRPGGALLGLTGLRLDPIESCASLFEGLLGLLALLVDAALGLVELLNELLIALPATIDLLVGDLELLGERFGRADGFGSFPARLIGGRELGVRGLDPRRRGGCPRSRGSGARRRRRTPRTWPGPVRRPHDPLPSPAVRPHPRRWREARASPPRAPARGPRAHPQPNRAPGAEPVASRSGAVGVRAGVPELPAPGRRPSGWPPTRLRPPPRRRRRRRAPCGGPTSAHPERWGSARRARGLQGVWPEAAGPGPEAAAGCRPSACPWRRRGRPSSPRPLDGARHGPDHAAPSPRPSWLRARASSAPAARCGPPGLRAARSPAVGSYPAHPAPAVERDAKEPERPDRSPRRRVTPVQASP